MCIILNSDSTVFFNEWMRKNLKNEKSGEKNGKQKIQEQKQVAWLCTCTETDLWIGFNLSTLALEV